MIKLPFSKTRAFQMLYSLTLKFSEHPQEIVVPTKGVTIIVGPNNSGKSLVLREIEHAINSHAPVHSLIVSKFELDWPTDADFETDIEQLKKRARPGDSLEIIHLGRFTVDGKYMGGNVHFPSLLSEFKKKNKHWMANELFKFFQIRLDGKTRFELTKDQPQGDLLSRPENILARLFQDEEARGKVRDIIFDAFGKYFVVDPTNGGQLRIRLLDYPPNDDEQSLSADARKFHSEAKYIRDSSDGIQAFTGIITSVLSGDYKLILVDEPEAFLHPPLAKKLGFHLATIASERKGSIIASTHSADFLMGCLQASSTVNVVRLEYANGKSKGHSVDSTKLGSFFKSPLIRSANVISGLFHDGVVVTESDNDRAFYMEIYQRLSEQEKGLPALLFVNAQNKQTIKSIVQPLREFGVPTVAISDIDILKDGGSTWTGWLSAANIPEAQHTALGSLRGTILKKYDDLSINMKTGGGISALPNSADREALNNLFDTLEAYGVFVVRNGELETWLPKLAIVGKKTDWTINALIALGDDPNSFTYIKPHNDDVWDFMRRIAAWVQNPSRRGIP